MGHTIIVVMVALSMFALVAGQSTTKPKLMECKSCSDCDDYLPDGSAVECSGSCFTYKGVSEQGSKVYRKGCLSSDRIAMKWDQEGCYNMDVDSYIGKMCVCNGHNCNASPALTIPLFTLLSAAAAFVCVRFLI